MTAGAADRLQPPAGVEVIDTGYAQVWIEDDRILRVVLADDVDSTLEHSKRVVQVQRELSGGVRMRIIVDTTSVRQGHPDARRYAVSPEVVAMHAAMVLIVRSPVSRVLVQGFLLMQKPPYPTKVVGPAGIEEGLRWLATFAEEPT